MNKVFVNAIIFFLIFYSTLPAQNNSIKITIDANKIITDNFIGFGAEWDSRNYINANINDADLKIIEQRVKWMKLPAARVMMQAKWCYTGNDMYNWNSKEMKYLYKVLDICKKNNTTVFLTDWGCEPNHLKINDVRNTADPKYAEIIATYLDYLINDKDYTNIKYVIMVNEPNYEIKNWGRWSKGIKNLYSELENKNLLGKISIAGSDQSFADDWHKKAVDELQQYLGAYDLHRYETEDNIKKRKLRNYLKESWTYAKSNDRNAEAKPTIIGEAGIHSFAQHPKGNLMIDSYLYGLLMTDYAIQATNAGTNAILAWMLDDNSHPNFFWGMWEDKDNEMRLRPWFYTWSLLSRYIPQGSQIVKATDGLNRFRTMATKYYDEDRQKHYWTVVMVNYDSKQKIVELRSNDIDGNYFKTYEYSTERRETDNNGFPEPIKEYYYELNEGVELNIKPNSVVIFTSHLF